LILLAITLASGLTAGCFCTAVEGAQAIGLIIKAEEFEVQEEIPEGTELDAPVSDDAQPDEWFPAEGAPRHLCTMLSNILCMWGFSMMLVGAFHARDAPVGGLDAVQDVKATLW
jgi:predicted cobalt transporter CbtA